MVGMGGAPWRCRRLPPGEKCRDSRLPGSTDRGLRSQAWQGHGDGLRAAVRWIASCPAMAATVSLRQRTPCGAASPRLMRKSGLLQAKSGIACAEGPSVPATLGWRGGCGNSNSEVPAWHASKKEHAMRRKRRATEDEDRTTKNDAPKGAVFHPHDAVCRWPSFNGPVRTPRPGSPKAWSRPATRAERRRRGLPSSPSPSSAWGGSCRRPRRC